MLRQHFEWVWNYRPPSDLFWLAWWTWSWYSVWPPIFLTDITQFLLAHGDVALTNDMLKDYKVGKAYEYFSSGWLQEGYFLKAKSNNNNNLCILRTKCSPSQTLDDDPHNVYILCQRRWWFDRRSLLFLYCRVWNLCMFFLNSLSCLCSANSGLLDNNRRDCNQWWAILAEMFLTNSWQNVVVTMVSMNQYISIMFEKCQFKFLWKLMIGVLY